MKKTNVMARFSIYGDEFDPNFITKQLGIDPCETYLKGELIKNGRIARKETSWSINTGYQDSFDINDQLGIITAQIRGKAEALVKIKQELTVKMLFMIVVNIERNEAPAMYFERDFLSFVNEIGAEIGFDVYVYN